MPKMCQVRWELFRANQHTFKPFSTLQKPFSGCTNQTKVHPKNSKATQKVLSLLGIVQR